MTRLYRLLEVLRLLDGEPDAPIDEVALAKQWGCSERTAYRLSAQGRSLLKEFIRRGVTIHFSTKNTRNGGRAVH